MPPRRRVVEPAKPARRAIAEVPLEDFNESINLLVYGMPGCGKTVFAGFAPNAVFISSEPGAISAKRAGSTASLFKVTVPEDAWQWLRDAQNGRYTHRDWAIIDTITMFQNKIMRATLDAMVAKYPHRDLDLPDKAEHQKTQNELKRWVEQVVDLPMNCLFLAHAMQVEDNEGGGMMLPSIQGGADKGYVIANYVMALMNSVGYMGIKTLKSKNGTREVRRILWQPIHDPNKDLLYVAKDHFGALGRYTDDATMPEIIEMIEGPKPVRRTRRARESVE
jgi:hypothetical protein